MKKVRLIVPLVVVLALASTVTLFAQQAPPRVAIVDSMRAFQTSAEGKKAYTQLQDRDAKIKSDIDRLDAAITALQNRMNTGRLTMTQEALAMSQADLEKKQTERKRYEEDATRDMQQLQQSLFGRIRNEMVSIIEAVAKEKGYDLVLDLQTSGAAYFNPAIDITEEIVKRYDATKAGAPPVKK